MEICKICSDSFEDLSSLLFHFEKAHLSQLKDISCLYCEKSFEVFDDLMHHVELDHFGMGSELLDEATKARETKKQLGNYIDANKKGVGLECPECFEIFPDVKKMIEHARTEHKRELDPKFIKQITNTIKKCQDIPPTCNRCDKKYIGVVFTRIDNKVQNVCMNCYEEYFGINALTRLTIGTNEDTIKKMRVSLD